MVVQRTRWGIGQPFAFAVAGGPEQFHVVADLRSEKDAATVGGPHRHIAAAGVKIRDIEELDGALVSAAVGHLSQLRAVGANEVGMAVAVRPGEEQQFASVRRPGRPKIEGMPGLDVSSLGAIRESNVYLVVLVVGNPLAIRRTTETVSES